MVEKAIQKRAIQTIRTHLNGEKFLWKDKKAWGFSPLAPFPPPMLIIC